MSRWKKLLIGILVLYLGVFVFIGMVIRLALWPSLGPDGAAFIGTGVIVVLAFGFAIGVGKWRSASIRRTAEKLGFNFEPTARGLDLGPLNRFLSGARNNFMKGSVAGLEACYFDYSSTKAAA
jgi:hypothetical protein